jgi:hypothetical protein
MKPTGKRTRIKPPIFDAEGYQTNMTSLNGEPLPDLRKGVTFPLYPQFHGGARAGAGRKPTGRLPIVLRLTPATIRALRTAAHRKGTTLSALAEDKLARIR